MPAKRPLLVSSVRAVGDYASRVIHLFEPVPVSQHCHEHVEPGPVSMYYGTPVLQLSSSLLRLVKVSITRHERNKSERAITYEQSIPEIMQSGCEILFPIQ